jgi:tetratricopeptide (TPR) repeat protein
MRALASTLVLLAPLHLAAPRAATLEPVGAGTASDAAVAPAAPVPVRTPAPAPSQAVVEKLGHGDRLFLAGEYRNALFAYQDAVYAAPRHPPARVRLGRAYLVLRYPAQAIVQAEAALAEEPDAVDAKTLLEEARAAAARAQGAAAGVQTTTATPAAPAGDAAPPRTGPRTFKLTPEPGAVAAAAASSGTPAATASRAATSAAAAQHYRTALGLLQHTEWEQAATELTKAIAADPKLSVAYSARGNAYFGLARYREAADDYKAALGLDPNMATPLYGLAECQRLLGHGDAAELYRRYAESRAPDVREDLRALAKKRAGEVRKH